MNPHIYLVCKSRSAGDWLFNATGNLGNLGLKTQQSEATPQTRKSKVPPSNNIKSDLK